MSVISQEMWIIFFFLQIRLKMWVGTIVKNLFNNNTFFHLKVYRGSLLSTVILHYTEKVLFSLSNEDKSSKM